MQEFPAVSSNGEICYSLAYGTTENPYYLGTRIHFIDVSPVFMCGHFYLLFMSQSILRYTEEICEYIFVSLTYIVCLYKRIFVNWYLSFNLQIFNIKVCRNLIFII